MTLDVYRGHKTTKQQQQLLKAPGGGIHVHEYIYRIFFLFFFFFEYYAPFDNLLIMLNAEKVF